MFVNIFVCQNRQKNLKIIDNEKPIIEKIKINEHEIKDEYDNNKILNIMKDKNIFVKLLYPVSVKLRLETNEKVLFISPYNKLCQQLRKDGYITLNKLLGVGIDDNPLIKMKK